MSDSTADLAAELHPRKCPWCVGGWVKEEAGSYPCPDCNDGEEEDE